MKKSPVLDLRDDIPEVEVMIRRAIGRFAKMQHRSSEKKAQPASAIELIFQYWVEGDAPYVAMNIDTRPQHQPDWVWTYNFFHMLKRPRWAKFFSIADESDRGIMIDVRGRSHRLQESDEPIEKWIGEMLAQTLRQARENGAFQPLLKAERCELGVVDIEGIFTWPKGPHRAGENLA